MNTTPLFNVSPISLWTLNYEYTTQIPSVNFNNITYTLIDCGVRVKDKDNKSPLHYLRSLIIHCVKPDDARVLFPYLKSAVEEVKIFKSMLDVVPQIERPILAVDMYIVLLSKMTVIQPRSLFILAILLGASAVLDNQGNISPLPVLRLRKASKKDIICRWARVNSLLAVS